MSVSIYFIFYYTTLIYCRRRLLFRNDYIIRLTDNKVTSCLTLASQMRTFLSTNKFRYIYIYIYIYIIYIKYEPSLRNETFYILIHLDKKKRHWKWIKLTYKLTIQTKNWFLNRGSGNLNTYFKNFSKHFYENLNSTAQYSSNYNCSINFYLINLSGKFFL